LLHPNDVDEELHDNLEIVQILLIVEGVHEVVEQGNNRQECFLRNINIAILRQMDVEWKQHFKQH